MLACFACSLLKAQERTVNEIYSEMMTEYETGNYKKAADSFTEMMNRDGVRLRDFVLYNGVCVYALTNQSDKAFEVLDTLTHKYFYDKLQDISTDVDLTTLRSHEKWGKILQKIAENQQTLPLRTRQNIKTKILQAKTILEEDDGKLWGLNIWNDSILVIDESNIIYSLLPLFDSENQDSVYYKTIDENALSYVNTTQKYLEKTYVTLRNDYMQDYFTIVHELFHLLQNKYRIFYGMEINYFDECDARKLLRLEYQALRNTLSAIEKNVDADSVRLLFNDALVFRKIRQSKYNEFTEKEIEIESMEGMANYTQFKLCEYKNKYQSVISEINEREEAPTYTRSFSYATGPAYGLIFDFLNVKWRKNVNSTHNFLNIYETLYTKSTVEVSDEIIAEAHNRCNYEKIEREENEKKEQNQKLLDYYSVMFEKNPTLRVKFNSDEYSRSYNMYGTLVFKDKGTIYSSIKGTDVSRKNFGDFSTISGKDELGVAGILSYEKDGASFFEYPLPINIEENKITGDFYEIILNDGYKIINTENGNMEIVKQ